MTPRKQHSTLSSTSSDKTITQRQRESSSNGTGFFSRFQRQEYQEDTDSDAGPSDYYNRSPPYNSSQRHQSSPSWSLTGPEEWKSEWANPSDTIEGDPNDNGTLEVNGVSIEESEQGDILLGSQSIQEQSRDGFIGEEEFGSLPTDGSAALKPSHRASYIRE
jgi:hypothetical protein